MAIQTRIVSTGLEGSYPRRYGPSAMPTGAAASVYDAPERSSVRQMTFANTTAGDLTVTVHLVSASGTAVTGNQLVPTMTIPANDVINVPVAFVLNAGDRIFALSSGAVNMMFNVYDREPGWL